MSQSELWTESGEFRSRLTRLAQQQYSAELLDRFERAKSLRAEIVGDANAVGIGAGRYVAPLPEGVADEDTEYVLKLALPNDRSASRDGKAQNRREATVWDETDTEYLLPVTASDPDGYWLVMPRGKPVTDETDAVAEWIQTAKESLEGVVWERDLTPENVVMLDGEFRLCDYGMSP